MCNLLVIKQRQKSGPTLINPLLLHMIHPPLQTPNQLLLPYLTLLVFRYLFVFIGINTEVASSSILSVEYGNFMVNNSPAHFTVQGPLSKLYPYHLFQGLQMLTLILTLFKYLFITLTLNPNIAQTCYFYLLIYLFFLQTVLLCGIFSQRMQFQSVFIIFWILARQLFQKFLGLTLTLS